MSMRLFIAMPVSTHIKNILNKISRPRSDWPVRWVSKDNFHITLFFLGNIDSDDKINQIKENITSVAQSVYAFYLDFGRIENHRNQVIWVRINNNNELNHLYGSLSLELNKIGFTFKKEYIPHITLARFRKNTKKSDLSPSLPNKLDLQLIADKIVLYKSQLSQQGSIYTEIFTAKLRK